MSTHFEDVRKQSLAVPGHSELGIASIVLFSLSCLVTLAILLQMAIAAFGGPGAAMIAFFTFFLGTFCNLAGAISGLAGLFQRRKKRSLAVWGLIANLAFPIINVLIALALSP
jgi:hypothetical protein